ncbi:MAG: hypothetical protein COU90_00160 [Candidatus Ryanbacteria bacterium CG10_big_fil_rev_8_21_14_0_10_43_42]|uniref:Uncharacterized protein n=1 Tax=Candidatus Ryanbacteria bacterium CG10_big_fil_rev_8_21_14_0_10_43_42 TaxID=1974864 RepID=A0A2M8KYA8_9BACT|nr:MAG: hypothetical protein COU90_00160 [Candidatus Ryanbacteria bacterium CG10_big_fil_rev_8_21_14_0_10_43_42]
MFRKVVFWGITVLGISIILLAAETQFCLFTSTQDCLWRQEPENIFHILLGVIISVIGTIGLWKTRNT